MKAKGQFDLGAKLPLSLLKPEERERQREPKEKEGGWELKGSKKERQRREGKQCKIISFAAPSVLGDNQRLGIKAESCRQ